MNFFTIFFIIHEVFTSNTNYHNVYAAEKKREKEEYEARKKKNASLQNYNQKSKRSHENSGLSNGSYNDQGGSNTKQPRYY